MLFQNIIGHERVINNLYSSLANNRFPHSVLFSGPEGIGKRTIAYCFARALLGEKATNQENVYKRIEHGTHPDLIYLDPNWGVKKPTLAIKIEAIRQLESRLKSGSYESDSLVVIIDPADAMTRGAANALLKTLEEPAPGIFFFLITTSPHRLPITIRSRCQNYRFSPLTPQLIVKALEKNFPDQNQELNQQLAQMSEGRISRAFNFVASDSYNNLVELSEKTIKTILRGSLVQILKTADTLGGIKDKEQLQQFLSLLEMKLLEISKTRKYKGKPTRNFDIAKWLDLLRQSKYDLSGNINKSLLFEHLLLEMRRR